MRIITDSAADFTRDELKALNVVCVPLQVAFGDDTYADGVTLTSDIFWSRLTGGETPKTSQPLSSGTDRYRTESWSQSTDPL